MALTRARNFRGINLYINPLTIIDSDESGGVDLLRAVNVDSYPYGAKTKRQGYVTHLGTADGSAVNSLFTFAKNDGTTLFLYRASGSSLYYSLQGTGAWTLAGNGTISPGRHVGYAILDNTLIVGDGVGSTRHTTNGTAFTNTTLAPIGEFFAEYQRRIYVSGTSSNLFYSTAQDATNWNTSGTSDSSSLFIPSGGKLSALFKNNDRLIITKNSKTMYKWDGFALVDMATDKGPTSPYSIGKEGGQGFVPYLNRDGIAAYSGVLPSLISNPIQPIIYNNSGSAVAGGTFNTAPGVIHRNNYFLAVGTTTDDIARATINNCIIKYDMQKNEFLTWSFANNPTALHSYTDINGDNQLIFGDSSGQCYLLSGTATTDNGSPIEGLLEFVLHLNTPELEKKWNELWMFFNPGCQAQIQIGLSDSFTPQNINWVDIGDARDGVVDYRFPQGSRSRLLFVRVKEYSTTTPFRFYGVSLDMDLIGVRSQ